jgi:hypothetical protein
MAKDSVFLENKAHPQMGRIARMAGYLAAIIINAALLLLVNFVIKWDRVSLLTPHYRDLLWLLNFTLAATMLANYFLIISRRDWFTELCHLLASGLSLVFALRLLQVFPFDFSAYAGFNWTLAVRIFLIFLVAITALATLVELIGFFRAAARGK